jgi:hypothetical protein
MQCSGGALRRRDSQPVKLDSGYALLSPPPPKSPDGLHDGIGVGSAAGIADAAGLGAAALRFGAALRTDFFFAVFFAAFFGAAFNVLRFLRAGAAFFLVDFFFAFALFAMIDLPILLAVQNPCGLQKETSL